MKYFLLLTFILSGFFYDMTLAQAPATVDIARLEFKAKRVISPAPEAAELGKYGNTPVSLYTGTPQISIPLYELKGNSLSLPLSLNFSASGFKPQDAPTWVGQNWSLNAGGVVSRAVRGNPDDAAHYYGQSLVPPPNDLFEQQDLLRSIKLGNREMEPDQYFYNFGSHSGKFVVLPDQQIVKKERDMLQIATSCISCESGSTITIVDENGNTYLFAAEEATRMMLGDDPDPDPPAVRSYKYVSAWYLSSITSADGREKMTFTYYYTSENAIDAENTNNRSVSRTYAHTFIYSGSGVTQENTVSSSINGSTGPFTWAQRRFLKDITFTRDGNTIAFIDMVSTTDRADSDFPGSRMLQRVDVYDASSGTNKLVKQYELGYGYYENPQNTYTKKRLRLDRLQEKSISAGTTNPPPYQFYYNMAAPMPPRFSTSLDHWGYFNNHHNTSIVPTVNIQPASFPQDSLIGENAIREPELDGAAYAMINKIIYPTNGYTTFEYELHSATVGDGATRILGGVRIKRIVDYAATGQAATVKDYS